MKNIISLIILLATLCSCNSSKTEGSEKSKILVLYYSQTGATKVVAEELQKQLNADIDSIVMQNPYSGDFNETISRCHEEMQNGITPDIKKLNVNIDDYDVVFLGYPVWFGTYAIPVKALIKDSKLSEKKIVTFCTFGSGGLNTSTDALKKELPNADITEGYGVRNARINKVQSEISEFLISAGFKEGKATKMEEFSASISVNDDTKKIFEEACGDYQMPLGTPIKVAIRKTKGGQEYKYDVENIGQNGEKSNSTIYVIKNENEKAEFTKVIR